MSNQAEHVTVVMATWNGAAHLAAQLESLAAQSHGNWSLFVSDDGSQDATPDILAEFGRRYPLRLVEGPGRGPAANFLFALTHPDLQPGFVALADQDDVWLKGRLARGMRRIRAAARGQTATPILYGTESMLADKRLNRIRASQSGAVPPGFAPALAQNLFAGHTIMLNPAALALLRHATGTGDIVWHDWWIYQLLAGAGARLLADPLPTVIYRQHGANAFGAATGLAGGIRRLKMVLSGEWRQTHAAHLAALDANVALLTPEARQILAGVKAAPAAGPGRIRCLRSLGLRRSSGMGDLLLAAAALFGRA